MEKLTAANLDALTLLDLEGSERTPIAELLALVESLPGLSGPDEDSCLIHEGADLVLGPGWVLDQEAAWSLIDGSGLPVADFPTLAEGLAGVAALVSALADA